MLPSMTSHRFRLLVGGLLAAILAHAQAGQNAADMKEIRDFRLSMDNIQRYLGAAKIITNDAAAKKCGDKNQNAKTLDDSEKALKSCAAAMADLDKSGMKPREFVVMTGALMSDFMTVSMKKAGQIKDYPPSISPENAAFLEQNFDKLQAMMGSMSGGK
jgi:hypothetical protein